MSVYSLLINWNFQTRQNHFRHSMAKGQWMALLPATQHVLASIGSTPVVPLRRLVPQNSASIFGKYEAGNPTSSLKDRVALCLIEEREKLGLLNPGDVIVAATAGNTGVALAMVCAVKGYKLVMFLPKGASLEKRKLFDSFGVELKLTDAEEGVAGAQRAARDYLSQNSGATFIDQFNDPSTVQAHIETTAEEILRDFPNGIDAFVMGVGTGGTISGVAQVLKKKFSDVHIVAVEPAVSAVLSGGSPGVSKIQQLGLGFIPQNLRRELIDRVMTVTDDEAYQMTRKLAREEGLLLGISSGANVFASLQIAQELGQRKKVLTVFCDAGQRYFSLKKFFTDKDKI